MCDYLIANRSDYYSFKEQGKLYENDWKYLILGLK
jgi:hypothetical protein